MLLVNVCDPDPPTDNNERRVAECCRVAPAVTTNQQQGVVKQVVI